MGRQSERLEREAEGIRSELAGSLAELRFRVTPGQIIDQLTDYAREGPAADFLRNLTREIRENPIPVLLIAIGISWLAIAASRSPRATLGVDRKLQTAPLDEIGADVVTRVEASPEECSLGLSAVDA
jgi:hypothetical protein